MERIIFIDSLRGFAMLLVVIGHILCLCFGCQSGLFIGINYLLEVDLFFFISGFLFNPSKYQKTSDKLAFITGKGVVYVITPLFLMCILQYIRDQSIYSAFFDDFKCGMWFTIALYEFIVFFICCNSLLKVFKCSSYLQQFILLSLGLILLFVFPISKAINLYNTDAWHLLGLTHFNRFIFFIIGWLFRQHYKFINNILSNSYVITVLIILFFLMDIYCSLTSGKLIIPSVAINNFVLALLGVVLTFFIFKRYTILSDDSYLGKSLKFIGRRTLDIYFLHYFILPYNLKFIGLWFSQNINQFLEYFLAIILSFIIILGSLAIGSIIRLSPLLAHWILGQPNKITFSQPD